MNSRTQGLALTVLAVVLIRMSMTGEYLKYVTPWMRWPLFGAGLVLLALGVRPAWGGRPDDDHRAGRTAWLLLLPVVVFFVVSPPPLGAFLAERRAVQPASPPDRAVGALPASSDPVPLSVGEFVWAASEPGDPMEITGRQITMTGFVSGTGDEWYLTRLEISCCAADATVVRVRIAGAQPPPRNQWVKVTGTWVEGSGRDATSAAMLHADAVVEIEAPDRTYG